jgi:hypothetical protein
MHDIINVFSSLHSNNDTTQNPKVYQELISSFQIKETLVDISFSKNDNHVLHLKNKYY